MNKLKNLSMIGAGAAGAVALTIGAAGIAGAQDDAPTLDDPAPVESEDTTRPDRGDRAERRQAKVDQLIEDGVITEEQAEDMAAVRAAVQEHREAARAEKQSAIADVLGISVDELATAREEGTSLSELAGDDLPAIVDFFTEQATERIAERVESGRITQEQADERLEGLDERIESRLENGGFGGRGEGHRGHGRGHGPRGGHGPADAQAEEASF
ncbi:MAG: hypothetical protein ACI81L_000649 [Verrucomicrobiales bacterium]|jgi:hypothetical protein